MTDTQTLLSLLGQWVTVTFPTETRPAAKGRLVSVMEQPSFGILTLHGQKDTFPASFTVAPTDEPAPADGPAPADETTVPRPWADLSTSGILWLINRTVFHPRGLCLTVHIDGHGDATGWSLTGGQEGEPWSFPPDVDRDYFQRVQATLATALGATARQLDCGVCFEEQGEEVHPHPQCPVGLSTAELHERRRHPDFEYATTEGPRKQWDDVGVPPCEDDGSIDPAWERNTDAGRDGWERFDYTEESYWRRRKKAVCTATFHDPFHGFATCQQHPADAATAGYDHEGRSQDGSTLRWSDGDNGSTLHRDTAPDTPDTIQDTERDTASQPCPPTRTPVLGTTSSPPATSTDTCPDTGGTRRVQTSTGIWNVKPSPVPRDQVAATIAAAFGVPTDMVGDRPEPPAPTPPTDDDSTLGPDGLTDTERELKTITSALEAELSQPDPHALRDLATAAWRALQTMPRHAVTPALLNAQARLALARQVLVEDGYFHPDEIGPDLAPRFAEWLSHHRNRTEAAEATVKRARDASAYLRATTPTWGPAADIIDAALNSPAALDAPAAPDATDRLTSALRDRIGDLTRCLADVLDHFTVPIPGDIRPDFAICSTYIRTSAVDRWRRILRDAGPARWAHPQVQGRCPHCRRESLFLGSGGYVTCAQLSCTRPDAATDVLGNPVLASAEPCPRTDCADAREDARRNAVAFHGLRADVMSAVSYIRQQRSSGPWSSLRHNRSSVLNTLPYWIKDPGPLRPLDEAARPTPHVVHSWENKQVTDLSRVDDLQPHTAPQGASL